MCIAQGVMRGQSVSSELPVIVRLIQGGFRANTFHKVPDVEGC
jgi:hypothetical protein